MTTRELTGAYVGDGAMAIRNGRIFVAFKPPGQRRNILHEVGATLVPIGPVPGAYYNEGGCSLAFDDKTGELLMLAACSTDPGTGGACRLVLWNTGIVVPAALSQVGPVGPRGPAGPPGPQGPAGVSGADAVRALAADLVTAAGKHD